MDHIVNSLFSNAWSPEPIKNMHFLHILQDIASDKYKDIVMNVRNAETKESMDYYKKKLISFTPCGTFDGKRRMGNIVDYPGLVPLDIDKIGLDKCNYIKWLCDKDPYVSAAFISPSGNGIKLFIQTDNTDPKEHREAFLQCVEYFEQKYNHYVEFNVDPSGKDYTRLCFVSWDEDAYYNGNAEVFHVDQDKSKFREESFTTVKSMPEGYTITTTEVFDRCVKMIRASKIGDFRVGQRNIFVYSLSCLLNEYGMPMESAITLIGTRYSSLGLDEIKATVKSAYKRVSKHGTKFMKSYKNNPNQQSLI